MYCNQNWNYVSTWMETSLRGKEKYCLLAMAESWHRENFKSINSRLAQNSKPRARNYLETGPFLNSPVDFCRVPKDVHTGFYTQHLFKVAFYMQLSCLVKKSISSPVIHSRWAQRFQTFLFLNFTKILTYVDRSTWLTRNECINPHPAELSGRG